MSEAKLMRDIQILVSDLGGRVFRNQVGTYELKDGRYLSSGLCKGSSDLIGWTPKIIKPEDVGKTLAILTALEIKWGRKKPTLEQIDFINAVIKAGGRGAIVYSLEEARSIMEVTKDGLRSSESDCAGTCA
jgi:hypothetical protein